MGLGGAIAAKQRLPSQTLGQLLNSVDLVPPSLYRKREIKRDRERERAVFRFLLLRTSDLLCYYLLPACLLASSCSIQDHAKWTAAAESMLFGLS
jgi:hypothetical protein